MIKTEHKVLVSAFLMGILIAVFDAWMDFLLFYEGTFLELLIFNIPPHEFYIRSVVVICFISFGFVVGRVLNQREQAMEHSEYLYSVLSVIRNVNQLIVKETDPNLLLQKACKLLIETKGYSHSWIVLFDANGQLTDSASAGLGVEFEHMLEMVRRGETLECMKRAMEQSGVLVFDALPLEHEACPIKPLCRGGVALVTRLESRGGVYGVFGVGAPVGMAAEEELSLFKEVADDIAYALYSHEVEDAGSRAHLALMESEKKYRLLAENTFDCIWQMDLNTEFTYVNPAVFRVFGFTPEEWVGSSLSEHCSPEAMEFMSDIMMETIRQGSNATPEIFETRMLRKDGKEIDVEITGRLILDRDGDPLGFQGTTRNITERKKAEGALQESVALLNATGQMAKVGGWTVDAKTQEVSWTEETYRIHEVPLDQKPPLQDAINFFHPDEREKLATAIQRALDNGESYDMELRFITAKGKELWTHTICKPQVVNGKTVKLMGTFQDITERKLADEKLRESEVRFRELFEKSPIGIELYDIEGQLVDANQATLDIFGVSSIDEVKDFKLFDDPNLTDEVKNKIHRGESVAYQTEFDFEKVKELDLYETSRNGIIHLDLMISPMILGGGNQTDTYIVHVLDITEKKQTEANLKFERERFIHVLNVLEDGIYVVNKNYDVEYVNLVIEREFGPVAGRKCYTYLHDRKEPCPWCKIDEVFAGNTVRWERYSEKNGRYYDLLDTPMKNADGSFSKFEIFRDITENKLAERAVQESEKQHRTLVSNIPGIVYRCELDDDWTMLFLSDRFQDITGYPSSDIIANQIRSYESIIHPDDRKLVRNGVIGGVEQQEPFAIEYRIQHAKGGVRWVHENGQAILDREGRVLYLDGVILDITEHRLAEKALRESDQMYRALFESANDAIFIMKDNLFLECNDMALKMFGCNREEILFHSPDEFSPKLQPDGNSSKKGALKRVGAALAGEPQFFEWRHTRCDGAFFDAEVGLNAVQMGDDLALQAIVRDITDRKRAEKEIQATAEAASLYLDLMGHDIRNHLQAIVMGTEILGSTGLNANQSSVTDLITESVERSRNLIQKVQVTRGLLTVPLSEKSLRDALENSLEALKETYEDLEIEVDYKIHRAMIKADQYLVNLLMNLLENAVIHNNKRPRRVWVTLRKTKGGFEIAIADNGSGISDEKKESLFDPERRFGGVGVHQALRIAQKYDGHISVDDRVANDASQGAKFRLWLPKLDTSTG